MIGIGRDREARNASGRSARGGKPAVMSSNSSSVRPTSGPRISAPNGKRVAGVGQHAHEGDEVLHLLAAEQAFPRLRGDREPARFERALIAPEIGAGRRQQRDAPGVSGDAIAVCRRGRHIADQPRAEIGDGLGFGVAICSARGRGGRSMVIFAAQADRGPAGRCVGASAT